MVDYVERGVSVKVAVKPASTEVLATPGIPDRRRFVCC
jgi:hypothetical protein